MFKVAYIGGGSMFLPSIINGVADATKNKGAFDVCLSLYDIHRDRAERSCRYADIVQNEYPNLNAETTATREEALDNADLVFVSVALYDRLKEINEALSAVNANMPEPGPGDVAEAVAVAPFYKDLAKDMKQYCPSATHISLVNPTDVIALFMNMMGVKAVGICVEVEGLRGALAYYFRVPEEAIEITHAGVNHYGWTLDLKINGQDGYKLLHERMPEIEKDIDFHPGNYGIMRIFELTGHLLSSGYHTPPFYFEPKVKLDWSRWEGKRESLEKALEESLQTRKPIIDRPMIHPERSLVYYPGTGKAIGRLIRAMATGEEDLVSLQVINNGAVSNFPDNSCVEVPTFVKGKEFTPQSVGELPDWFGGITRQLAIQRRMMAEYLVNPSLDLLKRSLSALPILASVEKHLRFAETLHNIYSG
jgi:alpha-galactosidase/6-phospho-beta-glucosidase family protein